MRANEIAVVKPFLDDDMDHPRQQCRIFPGQHWQVDISKTGNIALTRVCDDQF